MKYFTDTGIDTEQEIFMGREAICILQMPGGTINFASTIMRYNQMKYFIDNK